MLMSSIIKLSHAFLAQMKDRGILRDWRPPVFPDEEMTKLTIAKTQGDKEKVSKKS